MIEKIICFFKGHEENFLISNWRWRECLFCKKRQHFKGGIIIKPWRRW